MVHIKQIYFATTNKGKLNSVRGSFKDLGLEVIHYELEMPEPRSDDLQEIAREKVLYAYSHIKKPCIAVDSGFFIPSLNGFPKAFVNFALDTIGAEGILKLVEDKPRDCEFKNCLAYIDDTLKEPLYFESVVPGKIVDRPIGEKKDYFWSKLFYIFMPEGYSKTLAEMSYPEYLGWRKVRHQISFSTKFADYYLKKK